MRSKWKRSPLITILKPKIHYQIYENVVSPWKRLEKLLYKPVDECMKKASGCDEDKDNGEILMNAYVTEGEDSIF